jgi:hypothetical protein
MGVPVHLYPDPIPASVPFARIVPSNTDRVSIVDKFLPPESPLPIPEPYDELLAVMKPFQTRSSPVYLGIHDDQT